MTNPVPLELQAKIAGWRKRSREGTLTQEEMKEAILMLRAGRVAAMQASSSAKRKRAIAAIPSADDMLNELSGE